MSEVVLVTGGAGFIGSHLVRRLVNMGFHVKVLDNLSSGSEESVAEDAELTVGDVREVDLVGQLTGQCKWVFHLAAFSNLPGSFSQRAECLQINVEGTRNILEASLLHNVEKVVFSSTSALYPGEPNIAKVEAGPLVTDSPYAESKLQGEKLLERFVKQGGKGSALRYFNVFGPGQAVDSDYAAVIPIFIDRALKGQVLTICGDGHQTRDFVYVEDVVSANLQAALVDCMGVFNVGTGLPISIRELSDNIGKAMNREVSVEYVAPRPGDVASSTADIELATRVLGWNAGWSLKEGLVKTIAWWKSLGDR